MLMCHSLSSSSSSISMLWSWFQMGCSAAVCCSSSSGVSCVIGCVRLIEDEEDESDDEGEEQFELVISLLFLVFLFLFFLIFLQQE